MAYGRRDFLGLTGGTLVGWSLTACRSRSSAPGKVRDSQPQYSSPLLVQDKVTIDLYGTSLLVWPQTLASLDVLMPEPSKTGMGEEHKHVQYLLVRKTKVDLKKSAPATKKAPFGFSNFAAWPIHNQHVSVDSATGAITLTTTSIGSAQAPASDGEWKNLSWIPNLADLEVGPVDKAFLGPTVPLDGPLGARLSLGGGTLSSEAPRVACLRREIFEFGKKMQVFSDVCRFTLNTAPTRLMIRPLNDDQAAPSVVALSAPGSGDILVVNFPVKEYEPPCCSTTNEPVPHFAALYAFVTKPGAKAVPISRDCVTKDKLTPEAKKLPDFGKTVRCLKALAPQPA